MALILLGKSASGKDTIRTELNKLGMNSVVSYTTRPMRDGEIEDVTYHYVTQDEFDKLDLFGVRRFTVASGDVWSYGFRLEDLTYNSVLIIDPVGLADIKKTNLFNVSFFIDVADDLLYMRAMNRGGKSDEIHRRLEADRKDFFLLPDKVNFVINNDRGDVHITAKCIYQLYQNYVGGTCLL